MRRAAAIFVTGIIAVASSGCGGDSADRGQAASPDSKRTPQQPDVAATTRIAHVHGVDDNPADGSLLVATHNGLFRVDPDGSGFIPVGATRDVMGFTALGPNEFLASGHPGPGADAPPMLGLIRSTDGGRSWSRGVLSGEGDLHVIRSGRKAIYAYDSARNRIFEGVHGGSGLLLRTTPPGTTIDLAISPRSDKQVYAATDRGLFRSTDSARTWAPLDARRTGLIAFAGDTLTMVDATGAISALTEPGGNGKRVGRLPGTPAALSSGGEGRLIAATQEGGVYTSGDGGRRWSVAAVSSAP